MAIGAGVRERSTTGDVCPRLSHISRSLTARLGRITGLGTPIAACAFTEREECNPPGVPTTFDPAVAHRTRRLRARDFGDEDGGWFAETRQQRRKHQQCAAETHAAGDEAGGVPESRG